MTFDVHPPADTDYVAWLDKIQLYILVNFFCVKYCGLKYYNSWGTQLLSWLKHCAKSRTVAGSIADAVFEIFH
jgi:hypothetical protein